jgi:hypothetical protein
MIILWFLIGRGYFLDKFLNLVKKTSRNIKTNIGYTSNLAPNLTLVNDTITQRLLPFMQTKDAFLTKKLVLFYKIFKTIFKKKIKKLKFNYSKQRNADDFIKYRAYRLFVLKKQK